MQSILQAAGSAIAVIIISEALDEYVASPILGFLLVMVFWVIAATIHEAGHCIGARKAGMTLMFVRVAAFDFYPGRHRWRMRWSRQPRLKLGGYVSAAFDPDRPMRPQMLRMAAAGPAANLLTGCVLLIPYLLWHASSIGAILAFGFGVLNMAMGLANLVPNQKTMPSDGALILYWFRHKNDAIPALARSRLLASSVAGTTAENLLESDLAALEAQAMPAPLIAAWYRLKGRQNQGDWDGVLEQGMRFERALSGLSSKPAQLRDMIAQVRIELAFARAMRDHDASVLQEDLLSPGLPWLMPSLWPRCLALKAALAGHPAESYRLLELSMRHAQQSPDWALAKSEAMIAAHVVRIAKGW